jgi:hypothetical protein
MTLDTMLTAGLLPQRKDGRIRRLAQTTRRLMVCSQFLLPLLLCGLCSHWAALPVRAAPRWEAFSGSPFGVGQVTVNIDREQSEVAVDDQHFTVAGSKGRVLYPVLRETPIRRFLRRLLEVKAPIANTVTIYFLFQDNQPLELRTYAPTEQVVRITPRQNRRGHQRLLDQWWSEYSGRWNRLQGDAEYPMVVENFLTATLARRLNKVLPESPARILPWRKKRKETVWDELFANERYLLRTDREMLQGLKQTDEPPPPPEFERSATGNQTATGKQSVSGELPVTGHALPNPIAWSPPSYPDTGSPGTPLAEVPLDEIPVETIATHVPEECFYLRFGTFRNYLWFRDLNKKWQGDLQNMIMRRGFVAAAAQRVQQQLALRETVLAKILGPQIIADVALVGLDPYLAQGAAIGILFEAHNSFLLEQDLVSKRREALQKFPAATETNLTVAGHEVSLIATPDGQVRSFYAKDGDYHLVTTSRSLVARFYRAAGNSRSLAMSDGFRHARRQLPLERDDAVFAYVSSEFFQQFCSPALRIQQQRRVRKEREVKILELSRYASIAEGVSGQDMSTLIGAGLLPSGFGSHKENGETPADTADVRPPLAGSLVPLYDRAPLQRVTSEEIAAFRTFSAKLRQEVGQLPPLAVGIRRVSNKESGGERGEYETMIADVLIPYMTGFKFGSWIDNLGEASTQQLAPVAGDVASMEVILNIPVPLIGGEKQPHHLFGGLRDYRSPLTIERGALVPAAAMPELIRGYLGAWPRPGVLEIFGARTTDSAAGLQKVGDQLWQTQQDPFVLLSFKPEVIEQVLPQLALEEARRAAQIRLRIDSLADKKLAPTINALGYMRSRETSLAASRLMNTLANQLRVPGPDCRALAETLVDGKFVCPLGGEYQLFEGPGHRPSWASTGIIEANRFLLDAIPADFQLPLLEWFQGLRGDLRLVDQELTVHLEIDLSTSAVPK